MPSLLDIYGQQGPSFQQGIDGQQPQGVNGGPPSLNSYRPTSPSYQSDAEVQVFPYQGDQTYSPNSTVAPPSAQGYNMGHY
jgi:hypothetical protein